MSDDKQQDLINMGHARTDEQRAVMQKILEEGHCPFCTENLEKYHQQPIIKEGKYWLLTPNQWPYKFTRLHLLAIAKTHAEKISELPPEAYADLFELLSWAEKEYSLKSGAIGLRFGNTSGTGATVLHLHAHLIVADREAPGYEKVRFPVG